MEEDLFSRLERRPVPKAKKQFTINMRDKALSSTINIQEQNISSLSDLVFKIFQKIKN